MVTKLTNDEAKYFIELCAGKTKQQIIGVAALLSDYRLAASKRDSTAFVKSREAAYKIAETLFNSITFFDNPEFYRLNPWGYEQTNYENIKVVGSYKNTVIAFNQHTVYAISKNKYRNREPHTYLDNQRLRSTSWLSPYTNQEIAKQSQENMYLGH
ncbi:hypothetical protein WOSG25_070170 [Weissella oryzae SG25]|uniref:Uncharacterized protein n=1 Tax=Weissella oryzae (strain DSM 25784 / JCM 18191 / LMG 30913 / SG25) TaxID=1329250 RepID=A0A069CTA2_WEIOS|nr:hypothetical protein [Weissella oryzae]GAK31040.1 hypothetical protein WOSG25_070170 [Weissella oryzae SG25]